MSLPNHVKNNVNAMIALLPFAEAGCRVMGVDIDATRIEQARTFFAQRHQQGQFIATDIFQLIV